MSSASTFDEETLTESYYNTSQSAKHGSYSSSSSGYYLSSKSGSATKSNECGSKDKKKKPENECFKVVQMVSDPASPPPSGIIGYVYTYTIRKRRRVIKKGLAPKQPYQVVVVKEKEEKLERNDPDNKIKEADDEIDFANRQIARYCLDKERAKQRRKDAEELRFRHEEREKEEEVRSRYGRGYGSDHRGRSDRDDRKTGYGSDTYDDRRQSSRGHREAGRESRRQSEDRRSQRFSNCHVPKGTRDRQCDPCEEFRKSRGADCTVRKCYPCPPASVTIKYVPRDNQGNACLRKFSPPKPDSDFSEESDSLGC